MRGKLRDKHSTHKHDSFGFEDDVMPHPPKRSGRAGSWSYQWDEEETDFDIEEEEQVEDNEDTYVAEDVQLVPESEQEDITKKPHTTRQKVASNKH